MFSPNPLKVEFWGFFCVCINTKNIYEKILNFLKDPLGVNWSVYQEIQIERDVTNLLICKIMKKGDKFIDTFF